MPVSVTRAKFVVCAVSLKVAALEELPKRSDCADDCSGVNCYRCTCSSTAAYGCRPAPQAKGSGRCFGNATAT